MPAVLNCYPNPAGSFCHIRLNKAIRRGDLKIYNLKGELIMQQNVIKQNELTLKTNSLPAGIYLLKLKADGGTYTRKLIKF